MIIALPTAYTARINAISNTPIPQALQLTIAAAIETNVTNGLFTVDIPLSAADVVHEAQIASWLKSLGYVVDYTDQPNQTGQLEVSWG